jgi:hypothetical protein
MSTTQLERETSPPSGQLACPKPQYTNEDTGEYEPLKGKHGATLGKVVGKSGEQAEVTETGDLQVIAELAVAVQQLALAISQPQWYDPANKRISTGTVVTSCTLAANQDIRSVTNFDSMQSKVVVYGQNYSAWANACRSRIT